MKIMNDGLLPMAHARGSSGCRSRGGCSLVGDGRADENIALLSMHTVWVREHNRIAQELKLLNPGWNNNLLFDTTRKIVGALLQHITYTEYLSSLVKLRPYKGRYNLHTDSSIINSFATAAFRFGHSLIPNDFEQLDAGFNKKAEPVNLQKAFMNRAFVLSTGIESTMFGLVKNSTEHVDDEFSFSIARKLFIDPLDTNGKMDLTALNIQRGRDHGLPGYTKYRTACHLSDMDTWEKLEKIMFPGAVERLKKIYSSVQDIDLFAGGMSEKHISGVMLGPTFHCILLKQFEALRDGDRFYYENEGVFTPHQLKAIKKSTLSSVLCNNLRNIVSIQPRALLGDGPGNKRVSCKSIKVGGLDLKPWKYP